MSKTLAKILSVVAHPMIYPLLAVLFYFAFLPSYLNKRIQTVIFIIVFIGCIVMPLSILFLLKRVNIITSLKLRDPKERPLPLLMVTFIAFILSRLFYKLGIVPYLSFYFVSGGLAIIVIYVFLKFKIKVSIHTMGLGSFIGFIMMFSIRYNVNFLNLTSILFIVLGVVAQSRITLKSHTPIEVLLGSVIGISTQLLLPIFIR